MLYELGARISEIGNLRINDLTKTKHGFQVFLEGKTRAHSPEIIVSAPAVQDWIEHHPLRDKKNPPLWINLNGRNKHGHMGYSSIRMLIKRHAKKSGIKKRIYPHLFRHTRATHVVVNNLMTQSQAKKYFGWTPSSKQLDTYIHLTSKDANDSYKRSLGLIKEDVKKNGKRFNKKVCEICGEENVFSNTYCRKCHNPLDMKTAQRDALKREEQKQKEISSLKEEIGKMRKDMEKLLEKRIKEREDYWYQKFKAKMSKQIG